MWDSPSASCTPWHADLSRRSINQGGSHEAKVAALQLPAAICPLLAELCSMLYALCFLKSAIRNLQFAIHSLQFFFFLDIHNVALLF
jgi:hypothetical protein